MKFVIELKMLKLRFSSANYRLLSKAEVQGTSLSFESRAEKTISVHDPFSRAFNHHYISNIITTLGLCEAHFLFHTNRSRNKGVCACFQLWNKGEASSARMKQDQNHS